MNFNKPLGFDKTSSVGGYNFNNNLLLKQKNIFRELQKFNNKSSEISNQLSKVQNKYDITNRDKYKYLNNEKFIYNKENSNINERNEAIKRKTFLTNILDDYCNDNNNNSNEYLDDRVKMLNQKNKLICKNFSLDNNIKNEQNEIIEEEYIKFDKVDYDKLSFRDMLKEVELAQQKIKSNNDDLENIKKMVYETKNSIMEQQQLEDMRNMDYNRNNEKYDNTLHSNKSNELLPKFKSTSVGFKKTYFNYPKVKSNKYTTNTSSYNNKYNLQKVEDPKKELPKKQYLF